LTDHLAYMSYTNRRAEVCWARRWQVSCNR